MPYLLRPNPSTFCPLAFWLFPPLLTPSLGISNIFYFNSMRSFPWSCCAFWLTPSHPPAFSAPVDMTNFLKAHLLPQHSWSCSSEWPSWQSRSFSHYSFPLSFLDHDLNHLITDSCSLPLNMIWVVCYPPFPSCCSPLRTPFFHLPRAAKCQGSAHSLQSGCLGPSITSHMALGKLLTVLSERWGSC